MSRSNVVKTRKIASLHICVERAIGRIKQYHILSSVLPLSTAPCVDDIWFVVPFLLCSFSSVVPWQYTNSLLCTKHTVMIKCTHR